MSDIEKLTQKILKFRNERDWQQFHDHKSMAVSIVIEAAELLEHFQWLKQDELNKADVDKKKIGHEIADVAIYLFELCHNLDLDLGDLIEDKIKMNNKNYPVSKSKGDNRKYTEL